MSDQNDVFSEDTNQEATAPETKKEAAPVDDKIDLFVEKLASITREDGTPKYDSLEKALDALKASQVHIQNLETDNKTLAEQIKEKEKLEEVIKRLGGNMNNEEKPEIKPDVSNGGLSEEAAVELVKKVLMGERQTANVQNNIRTVNDKLVNKYGEEGARKVLADKAKELGTTVARLRDLAAENPNVVLSLFGSASSTSPSTTSYHLSAKPKDEVVIKRPEKSLLSGAGATGKNRKEFMQQLREKVYKELKVET